MATDAPFNPFEDLAALRVTSLEEPEVEQITVKPKVRKPKPREFYRVNPDEKYSTDVAIFEHEVNEFDKDTYIVMPRVVSVPALRGEVRPARVFVCMNLQGEVFLFAAKLPSIDGGGREWAASALRAVEKAKAHWTRMSGKNKKLGQYEIVVAKSNLGEPKWPSEPLPELMELAWGDMVISSEDHPVIRELNGEM